MIELSDIRFNWPGSGAGSDSSVGKLSTQGVNSRLASAAYSIAGEKTEKYEYR